MRPAFAANIELSLRNWDGIQKLEVAEFRQTTQMDAFARNILDNTPVLASGEEGLIDMQLIDAIKTAIESGKEVEIEY